MSDDTSFFGVWCYRLFFIGISIIFGPFVYINVLMEGVNPFYWNFVYLAAGIYLFLQWVLNFNVEHYFPYSIEHFFYKIKSFGDRFNSFIFYVLFTLGFWALMFFDIIPIIPCDLNEPPERSALPAVMNILLPISFIVWHIAIKYIYLIIYYIVLGLLYPFKVIIDFINHMRS